MEFTIGLGPAILKKKTKSGMIFAIRLLPIGGACIFEDEEEELREAAEDSSKAGEDDTIQIQEDTDETETVPLFAQGEQEEQVEPVSEEDPVLVENENSARNKKKRKDIPFREAPVYARIATVVAGPFFNVILAFLLSIFLCWFCGMDLPILAGVMDDYPAQQAGLQEGDNIRKINTERIYTWREISTISMLSAGHDLDIEYERDGQIYNTVITPKYSEEDERFYIGFEGGGAFVSCQNLSVFKYSAIEVRFWLISTVRSLGYLFGGHASPQDLAGPVGVATVIDDTIEETSQYGVFTVILNMINIAVCLSVNLGVMNLLPIPALDGGRLIFLLIEAVRGKTVPKDKEGIVTLVGVILLIILMLFVLFNDILRIVK